jgi:hypothetical protein
MRRIDGGAVGFFFRCGTVLLFLPGKSTPLETVATPRYINRNKVFSAAPRGEGARS